METKKININGYAFTEQELSGRNPFNDNGGTPIPELTEQSYAWCEAAYIYRMTKKIGVDSTLDYNNFGSCEK